MSLVVAGILKAVFLGLFIAWSNPWLTGRVRYLARDGRALALVAFFGVWIVFVVAIFVVSYFGSWPARVFWAAIFVGSAYAVAVFRNVSNDILTCDDLLNMWLAIGDYRKALATYGWHGFVGPLIPGVFGLLGILVSFSPPPGAGAIVSWALPAAPLALVLAIVLRRDEYAVRRYPAQLVGIAVVLIVICDRVLSGSRPRRDPVSMGHAGRGRCRNIVLVIDESVRGDFIDLNVMRGTTPSLVANDERVANYGIASSGSNCSVFSDLILRWGGRRDKLGRDLYRGPTIWNFARQAGYETVLIDTSSAGSNSVGLMDMAERSDIDRFIQLGDLRLPDRDRAAAETLADMLSEADAPPRLYFLMKTGAHTPYQWHYPSRQKTFEPDSPQPGPRANHDLRTHLNAYMNAVRWNVDGFFAVLLERSTLSDTLLIYTSDHGQNLTDPSHMTHATVNDPPPSQGVVPLLAVTDDIDIRAAARSAAAASRHARTHFSIFPTILWALGYDRDEIAAQYGATLLDPIREHQAFSSGSILGNMGRVPRWTEIGDATPYLQGKA